MEIYLNFFKIMRIIKFIVVIFFLTFNVNAKELPKIDTKYYLGIYKSLDKFSAIALSPLFPNSPYYTETDDEKKNIGFFLGYNFYLDNFLIGIESNFQENIGKDQSIAGLNGSVTYEKMQEAKIKIGYKFDDFDFFTYLGGGDIDTTWTAYHSDPSKINNYYTRGLGIDYYLNENFLLGLSFDETTFDIFYINSLYVEEVHKRSIRLRFGYLF